MSTIYILEPPTNGKVLLHTSVGEIDIELWSKEAPKACRNFVQLCMEGYYDGTIFHRIVKDFIAQGGDPTGTGTGGDSIYGGPFKDEFHQRLKFTRRGLVAMANAGLNDNTSQFFFTLDVTKELDKKHTIFGKVTGDTIYNMIRLNEVDVGEEDRPIDPPRIKKTEILSNPFDDIVPRISKKDLEREEKGKKKVKSQSKATKNYKLLSFGEEAEEDEEETNEVVKDLKIKSSHDLLQDPKLLSAPAIDEEQLEEERKEQSKKNIERDKKDKEMEHKLDYEEGETIQNEIFNEVEEDEEVEKDKRRRARKEEMKKLKKEIRGIDKPDEDEVETENKKRKQEMEIDPSNDMMRALVSERKEMVKERKNKQIFKKGGGRESETLALLAGFSSKLGDVDSEDEDTAKERIEKLKQKKKEKESKGATAIEEGEESSDDENWMGYRLNFDEGPITAKDANMKGDDWYDIYDPRNPLNQRRLEESKKKMKEKATMRK